MDIRASANVSQITDLQNQIALLKAELQKANVDLGVWKIEFDVDVEPQKDSTYQIVIIGTSSAGKGFRKIIDQEQILYLMVDKHDIIKSIAEEFLLGIAGDAAYNALFPKLSHAFDNVLKLTQSKGFAK